MARRDVPFWTRVAAAAAGPVLELGCGTGRVALPVARHGAPLVGIDLSAPMLRRARTRMRRARLGRRLQLVRGDIRALPFPDGHFALVMAPYGILQSLTRDRDLAATLAAVAAALRPGGRLVMELVADLPSWQEYANETRLRGWRTGKKAHLTLVESVRQDRRRGSDGVRAGVRRAPRTVAHVTAIFPGLQDPVGAPDGQARDGRRPLG